MSVHFKSALTWACLEPWPLLHQNVLQGAKLVFEMAGRVCWSIAVWPNHWPPTCCSSFTAQIDAGTLPPSLSCLPSMSLSVSLSLPPSGPRPIPYTLSYDPSLVLKWNRLGQAVYPLFGVRQASPGEAALSLNDSPVLLSTPLWEERTVPSKLSSGVVLECVVTSVSKKFAEGYFSAKKKKKKFCILCHQVCTNQNSHQWTLSPLASQISLKFSLHERHTEDESIKSTTCCSMK